MLLLFILKNTVRHIYQHYILRHGCCGVWSGVRKVVEMWELGHSADAHSAHRSCRSRSIVTLRDSDLKCSHQNERRGRRIGTDAETCSP